MSDLGDLAANRWIPNVNTRGLWHVLKWMLTREQAPWQPIDNQPRKVTYQRVPLDQLWLTFINHSTVLIQLEGLNILTDPIWSDRCSPFKWMGPKRMSNPGIELADLPPIDLVLLSHNHYDHMDLPTLRYLQKEYHPYFYVAGGNKKYLEKKGLSPVQEFSWWESLSLDSGLTMTFVPTQHFSARGLFDRNATLWGGFYLKGRQYKVYFAGDTGYCPVFKEVKRYLGSPTVSLLPIGAYKPRWFMQPMHMCPYEAVQAHLDLESSQSMGIHFGTFPLADEGGEEPLRDLEKALKNSNLSPSQFWTLELGEGKQIEINL